MHFDRVRQQTCPQEVWRRTASGALPRGNVIPRAIQGARLFLRGARCPPFGNTTRHLFLNCTNPLGATLPQNRRFYIALRAPTHCTGPRHWHSAALTSHGLKAVTQSLVRTGSAATLECGVRGDRGGSGGWRASPADGPRPRPRRCPRPHPATIFGRSHF